MQYDHDELVALGVKWLNRKCVVVTSEMCTGVESPDVIGWLNNGDSILIECKISKSDFIKDSSKSFRMSPHTGAGKRRYYLTEPGLINVDDLPSNWGLIEVKNNRYSVKRRPTKQLHNAVVENSLLISACRRLAGRPVDSVSVKFYPIDKPIKTTLGVIPE